MSPSVAHFVQWFKSCLYIPRSGDDWPCNCLIIIFSSIVPVEEAPNTNEYYTGIHIQICASVCQITSTRERWNRSKVITIYIGECIHVEEWVTNQLRMKGIIFPLAVFPRLGASETTALMSRPCRLVQRDTRAEWASRTSGLAQIYRASCRLCDCDHRIIVIVYSSPDSWWWWCRAPSSIAIYR